MVYLRRRLAQLVRDRAAVTAIEYALIAALIAVVIIAGVSTIGQNASNTFNTISTEL